MLDERERVERVRHAPPQPEPQREPERPAYSQWLYSLSCAELVELFSDPAGAADWHEELRSEILELIRAKGGDQAVRRALGLHFDRPASLTERPSGPADAAGRRRDPWVGLSVARPGLRRAMDRVGRAFVEATLRWRWEVLRDAGEGESDEAADRRALEGGPGAVLDLTEPFAAGWPDLIPPRLAEGAPGLTLDLAGPRRPLEPEARLLQMLEAAGAVIGAGHEATRWVSVFGHGERSDGRAVVVYRMAARGLEEDAVDLALDERSPPGVWVGAVRRLVLFARPLLAQHDAEGERIVVAPLPLEGTPDPLRPGPIRVELGVPGPTFTLRIRLGPEVAAGVTGVLNAPRVLDLLRRLTNLGFLPAGDPGARLPAPAPVVGRERRDGVAVTWRRRPGDRLAAAELEGPPAALATRRAELAQAAGEDALRAAALTEPDGPVPALLPGDQA